MQTKTLKNKVLFTVILLTLAIFGAKFAAQPIAQATTGTPLAKNQLIPETLRDIAQDELTEFGDQPYPSTVAPTRIEDLLPYAHGAKILSSEGESVVYSSPDSNPYTASLMRSAGMNPQDGSTDVTVVTESGDIAVQAALRWECAWISEYVRAGRAGNDQAVQEALTQLERFPSLEAIRKYNPELGAGHAADVLPRLRQGDQDFAQYWLDGSCSGLLH
ncbi:hypothetical protein [Schaalia sp. lx-260]|uniref:hypothetical protein n=1 Tax=Schaalia sp. lx-260 TaxID=2899082 RepID=UPI001E465814|nr:hypothetical protein [Schaalia sp. lx-260]MCD4550226.1 hypothetical protein [Schaalia sp. lx-260]